MASLEQIYGWFKRGFFPTEDQYKQTFSSFLHRSERLPQTQILGLTSALGNMATKEELSALGNGIIKQDAVDTYYPKEGKTSLLETYPTPQKGWDVLVLDENTRYNWNGVKWVNMNTGVYENELKINLNNKVSKSYSNKREISFLNSDDQFMDYKTGEIKAGNNLIRSVTIPLDNVQAIKIDAELVTSTNNAALVIFLNENGNIDSYKYPFSTNGKVSDVISAPSVATHAVISFRVGKDIQAQLLFGELIDYVVNAGYSDVEIVDFSVSDNNYVNIYTSERKAGNNVLRSVTKSLDNIELIRYKTDIIKSDNQVAFITYLNANKEVVMTYKPFVEDTFIQGEVGKPENATDVVFAFRTGRNIEVQLLSGKIIDDTVRESKLKNEIKKVETVAVAKDHTEIMPVSFADANNTFTDYLTGEIKAGNNLINSVTKKAKGITKIQYEINLVTSGNMVAGITFLDEYRNVMGYHLPYKSDGIKKGEAVVPPNVYEIEFAFIVGKRIFINLIGETVEDTTVKKKLKVIKNVSFENADNFFIHFQSGATVQGNNLINSVTVDLTDDIKFIHYTVDLKQSVSAVAVVTYLDENGNIVDFEQKYDSNKRAENTIGISTGAKKAVLAFFVGSNISVQLLDNVYVDDYVRGHELAAISEKVNNNYSIARTLYDNPKTGESKVGNFRLECNVKKPQTFKRLSANNISYIDVNKCRAQFDLINGNPKTLQDRMLNKMKGEVIDFTPDDDGFVRYPIGKDSQDRFYYAYIPSYRKGTRGSASESRLEVSTDFVNFKTIWKGATGTDTEGLTIPDFVDIEPMQVKELGNGNLLIASGYTRADMPSDDGIGTKANIFSGYFILSEDYQTINLCNYSDLEGNIKPMNSTHHVMNGSTQYSNQQFYDWSVFIYNNIVVASEYGDRENAGIVWYSEDNGETFKQIFWMPNHYNEGVTNGDNVTYTHIHGVFYDHYRNRIYIIAGEANSNLFWSDKGINTTDNDWHVENIRLQTRYPHLSYMQVVNGYPFRDCLIYGSDFTNMGAFMRVNREKEGMPQQMEVAHEILPQLYSGTLYCAGGITQRDQNSPVLMCMTRENAMSTPEQQTEHLKQHLSRVVATYDGFNFFEIWLDDTYGSYEVFNMKTWKTEVREFAKCTRDMTAWLCANGDLIIKYSGRPFVYMTADYTEVLHGNFCSQIVRYKNVARFL